MYGQQISQDGGKVALWGSLVQGFLRPPRSTYDKEQLGGPIVMINGTQYLHQEALIPYTNVYIELTLYKPSNYNTNMVVLYLHGNSSSKLEMESLFDVLPPNYSLAGFDFLSCGNSEDPNHPYVSYGVFESQQVAVVTQFLENLGYYVILWGRSMGAISALKFGGTQVIVADSACASIKRVVREQIAKNKSQQIPSCFLGCFFPLVYSKLRSDVQYLGGFDVNELNIKRIVAAMPPDKIMIFLSGDEDSIIDAGNSQTLFNCYSGQFKQLLIFKGRHNSVRPKNVLNYVFNYIESVLFNQQRTSLYGSGFLY